MGLGFWDPAVQGLGVYGSRGLGSRVLAINVFGVGCFGGYVGIVTELCASEWRIFELMETPK